VTRYRRNRRRIDRCGEPVGGASDSRGHTDRDREHKRPGSPEPKHHPRIKGKCSGAGVHR
jgi:hypothetical protein